MLKFWRKLFRNQRGNALMIAAGAMPMLVGCAGLANDTIQWTLWKRQLQRAADSAAMAGVYDRANSSGSSSTVPATVSHDLTLNQHTWMSNLSGYPQISYPADSGVMKDQVKVSLAVQKSLPFSSLFMTTAPIIVATATAARIPAGGDACVQALETSGSATGITNSGNNTVNAPNCILYSNSPSTNSATAGGSSSVTAKAIAAVGGIAQSNNYTVQQYLPYSPPLADPFANVTPDPNDMKCTSASLDQSTNIAAAIASGTNCWSSLSLGPNRTLDLGSYAGPVYINGGNVDLKGNFTCVGCTIVLTNKSTAPNATIGTFTSNAQASNNITAPTSGTYKGIAMYQDRRATGNADKINGGSGSVITGAVYFPSDILSINGSGSATSLCLLLIARRLVFLGNSSISLLNSSDTACAAVELPKGGAVQVVRLVA